MMIGVHIRTDNDLSCSLLQHWNLDKVGANYAQLNDPEIIKSKSKQLYRKIMNYNCSLKTNPDSLRKKISTKEIEKNGEKKIIYLF